MKVAGICARNPVFAPTFIPLRGIIPVPLPPLGIGMPQPYHYMKKQSRQCIGGFVSKVLYLEGAGTLKLAAQLDHLADDADRKLEYLVVGEKHWGVGGVHRYEGDAVFVLPHRFDGRVVAVDQHHRYVSIIHIRLSAHDDHIPFLEPDVYKRQTPSSSP